MHSSLSPWKWRFAALPGLVVWSLAALAQPISAMTFTSLLRELADPAALTRLPDPPWQCLQASSYNRASTHRLQPDQGVTGWFADSDGTGFLRTDTAGGRTEWVLLEHDGPGCLTKFWTPFFYYDFNDRVGPNLRVYLDGSTAPVLDEPLIRLVRGEGTFPPPLAAPTARAGNSYVPIPFARSCKVTLTAKPFYHLIQYRAYPPGTPVETFSPATFAAATGTLRETGERLLAGADVRGGGVFRRWHLKPGATRSWKLPRGPAAVRQLAFRLPGAAQSPAGLRTTALGLSFDGEETVHCPLGDFFSCPDALHPFQTAQRQVSPDGTLVARWVMPYRRSAELRIHNAGPAPVELEVRIDTAPHPWDERTLHFHANWRPDAVVPGTPFQDWNFIDLRGQGLFVGDAWTVLNPQGSWWGEGDEKIYVDGAWERGFPTHFGTGTEDYYGWAGGEVPTRRDEFSTPFLANVRVGGLDGGTTGFNICARMRGLDAIPFEHRLVFDMESSFGTDIRNPWNLLGYSAVTFWYARPGATHNRPTTTADLARPLMSLPQLRAAAAAIRARGPAGTTAPR